MKVQTILPVVVLLILFTGPLSPQETPSTGLDQCRAEVASWTHDFSYTSTANAESLVTFGQLMDRTNELKKCSLLEDKEPYRGTIPVLEIRYEGLVIDRLRDSLVRHDLFGQFQKEDAGGLR
jgi:hypothetical protein